ncbi:MAG: hypothetical protein HOK57_09895, partial [Planctomycetaceae bacterium]|nr:hypothetical protein [Planctomycetaceae bacterium]
MVTKWPIWRLFFVKIITLDGPAGAGKSSTAKLLASKLGWC